MQVGFQQIFFVPSFFSKKLVVPTKIKENRVIMYTNSNTVDRKRKQNKTWS